MTEAERSNIRGAALLRHHTAKCARNTNQKKLNNIASALVAVSQCLRSPDNLRVRNVNDRDLLADSRGEYSYPSIQETVQALRDYEESVRELADAKRECADLGLCV